MWGCFFCFFCVLTSNLTPPRLSKHGKNVGFCSVNTPRGGLKVGRLQKKRPHVLQAYFETYNLKPEKLPPQGQDHCRREFSNECARSLQHRVHGSRALVAVQREPRHCPHNIGDVLRRELRHNFRPQHGKRKRMIHPLQRSHCPHEIGD